MSKLAKTARNAMIADVALAFARDRLATKLPGVEPRRKRSRGKLLLIGGAALAGGALLLSKREKVTALLPGRADEPAPPPPEPQASPPISNYDVRGPVENTSTPVPTPAPFQPPAVDEAAEEAAAAAEAANIGGQVSDYAGTELGETAAEAERPLMEAGEGEAEGQEQTEAELAAAAEPTAPGMSDEERQIEDAIEAAGNPATPERVEPLVSGGERADEAQQRAQEEAPQQDDGAEWRTWSGRTVNP